MLCTFNSTGDIRDAIYEEWYKERLKSARKKKQEEEKAKKEKEEKERKVCKLSYQNTCSFPAACLRLKKG